MSRVPSPSRSPITPAGARKSYIAGVPSGRFNTLPMKIRLQRPTPGAGALIDVVLIVTTSGRGRIARARVGVTCTPGRHLVRHGDIRHRLAGPSGRRQNCPEVGSDEHLLRQDILAVLESGVRHRGVDAGSRGRDPELRRRVHRPVERARSSRRRRSAKLLAPFQISAQLMAMAKPDAFFMHCLPAERGREVTADVIDGPQSVVFEQAQNRLHVQKAILCMLLGA